ncbi:MAG: hypothetical protein WAU32_10280 [Thermoanaerobaculia bacterium]
MTEPAIPAEPIPFRVLLDEAMRLTRRHFGKIYLPVAIPLALLSALLVLAQSRWMSGAMAGQDPIAFWTGPGCVGFVVTMLAALVVQFLSYGVLTAAGVDGATGKPIDMKAKWAFMFQPSVLGTLFLAFLAVAAGLICLVLPGLYIALMLSFVIPVMALEGLRGGAALRRSWQLVRYNPRRRFIENPGTKIFLLYLVAGVIGWLLGMLIQIPLTAIQGMSMARQLSSGGTVDPQALVDSMRWVQVPSAILGSLVSTAVRIYSSFGVVLLFIDVVRRKEGTDLAAAINARFGGGDPNAPPPSTAGSA